MTLHPNARHGAEAPVREGQKPPPTIGERYVFTDFVGAAFEATFAGYETVQDPEDGTCLRLHFEDHGDFTTNLPIDYELVPA